jgi:hypothetical protein
MTDRKFKVGDIVVCINPTDHIDVKNVELNMNYRISTINEPYIYLENNSHPWLMHRFKLSDEQHEPKCVMTQDQFAALKASLDKLQAENKTVWINRGNSNVAIYRFFEEMEKQGLMSEPPPPKPKTAKEIAIQAIKEAKDIPSLSFAYGQTFAALQAISELPD